MRNSTFSQKLTARLLLLACLFTAMATPAMAQKKSNDCCVFMDASTLSTVREHIKKNTAGPETKNAYKNLLVDANKAMTGPIFSVTDKGLKPPSGDKHDYLSIGVYWWPDKKKKDGKPWIRKDGNINPATKNDQTDSERFSKFTAAVQTLALAGYLSGEDKYNEHATKLIRAWFIAPDTRMNPNLQHAQIVPGKYDTRAEGVLDGRFLATRIVDSLLLVKQTASWTDDDEQKMRTWMEDYFNWLTTSKTGKEEGRASNNHGTWYNVQAAGIARYLGKDDQVRTFVERTKQLVDKQIAANGTQPLELARPRSFHYSYFNLQPLVILATLGTDVGIDIWHYKNSKGGSILSALDYMAPYANPSKTWPHKNTERESLPLVPLLIAADNSLKKNQYQQLIKAAKFNQVPASDTDGKMGNVKLAEKESWLMTLPHFAK